MAPYIWAASWQNMFMSYANKNEADQLISVFVFCVLDRIISVVAISKISRLLLAAVPEVTGHFVPRSFRTQVISYHFGQFVPTFIFDLVILYPDWPFHTRFGRFIPTSSFMYEMFLVILYLVFNVS